MSVCFARAHLLLLITPITSKKRSVTSVPNGSNTQPIPIILSPRDSYMILLLLSAAAAGLAGLVTGGDENQAVVRQLGDIGKYAWFSGLLIGGSLALGAVLLGKSAVALMWEKVGLLLLSGTLFAFGTAYMGINGLTAYSPFIAAVGVIAVAVLFWKKHYMWAVFAAAGTLMAMGASGTIIIFGVAIANLDRIIKINQTLKLLDDVRERESEK